MLKGLLNRFTRGAPQGLEQRSYTLAVSDYLERVAAGSVPSGLTAFREIAAGLWGRTLASATITPDTPATRALTPAVLESIGRSLLDPGEAVYEIVVADGAVTLRPASAFVVTGTLDWTYEITLAGPTGHVERTLPADAVIHPRYGATTSEPWRGVGPLSAAKLSTILSNILELRLRQEASARVGFLLPVPEVQQALQDDLNTLEGKTVLVQTTAGAWEGGPTTAAPKGDYDPKRLGAVFGPNHEPLRDAVGRSMLAACGVPASLLGNSDGTFAREALRQFLHTTISPVADIITPELALKLDTPDLAFNFDKLFASDLSGRARAFQSMVGGGIDVEKAAALAGLMEPE